MKGSWEELDVLLEKAATDSASSDSLRKMRSFYLNSVKYWVCPSESHAYATVIIGSDGTDSLYQDFALSELTKNRTHRMPSGYPSWKSISANIALHSTGCIDDDGDKGKAVALFNACTDARSFVESVAPVYCIDISLIEELKNEAISPQDLEGWRWPLPDLCVVFPSSYIPPDGKEYQVDFVLINFRKLNGGSAICFLTQYADSTFNAYFEFLNDEGLKGLPSEVEICLKAIFRLSFASHDQENQDIAIAASGKGFGQSSGKQKSSRVLLPRWLKNDLPPVPRKNTASRSHASPIPHQRRGHYRTLHKHNKVVWVKQTFVNKELVLDAKQ